MSDDTTIMKANNVTMYEIPINMRWLVLSASDINPMPAAIRAKPPKIRTSIKLRMPRILLYSFFTIFFSPTKKGNANYLNFSVGIILDLFICLANGLVGRIKVYAGGP